MSKLGLNNQAKTYTQFLLNEVRYSNSLFQMFSIPLHFICHKLLYYPVLPVLFRASHMKESRRSNTRLGNLEVPAKPFLIFCLLHPGDRVSTPSQPGILNVLLRAAIEPLLGLVEPADASELILQKHQKLTVASKILSRIDLIRRDQSCFMIHYAKSHSSSDIVV